MRFYTKQHPFYCGIDLHARSMDVCIVNHDGEILVHRNMQAAPEPFLKAVAPYRDGLVVAVECLFTWDWLADLCTQEGIPFVLGHALSMKALHGGKATNDTIASHKIAALLRGGMLPQAYVSPAALRATRDLLRRRMPLMRQRAALLAHLHHTTSQDNLPAMGKKMASKANRAGVAERFPDPAVQQSMEVDRALIDYDDPRRNDVELSIVRLAQQHDPDTFYRRHSGPGIGTILRLVLLYAIHDIRRFPRVQACLSSGRLVTCAQESAGQRYGTAGAQIGNASLTWACSEAAVLFLRDHPAGQPSLPTLENTHGQGTALTLLAQKLARAVYNMFTRHTACDRHQFLHA
jgi:transposase